MNTEMPELMRSVRTAQGGAVWEYRVNRLLGSGSAALVFDCSERQLPGDSPLDVSTPTTTAELDADSQGGTRVALKRMKAPVDQHTKPRLGAGGGDHPLADFSGTVNFEATQGALATGGGAGGDDDEGGEQPSRDDDAFGCEEARLLSLGRGCPYVVGFQRGFVNREGIPFIAMELLQGGSLLQFMRSETQTRDGLPDGIAATYICQVARALEHLHSRRVVHCDVKALNVFLSHDKRVAKLGDLGSAVQLRQLPNLEGWCRPATPGSQVPEGSAFWMSPERIAGVVHPCADVWGLGCLAIELLTGRPPFYDFATAAAVLNQLWKLDAAPLRQLDRIHNLSTHARDFITACLQLHPTDRPTAAELLQHPWIAHRLRSASASTSPARPGAAVPSAGPGTPVPALPAATPPPTSDDALNLGATTSASGSFARTNNTNNNNVALAAAADLLIRGATPPVSQTPLGLADAVGGDTPTQSSIIGRTDSYRFLGNPTMPRAEAVATGGGGRTEQRNSALGVLESACDPQQPVALARWLLGVQELGDVPTPSEMPTPTQPQPSAAAPGPAGLRQRQGSFTLGSDMSATVGSAFATTERRRAARESVALIVNEIANSVNMWRTHRSAAPGRQGAAAEGADAELDSARSGAMTMIKLIASVAAKWRPMALDLLHRRLSLTDGGVSIAENAHRRHHPHDTPPANHPRSDSNDVHSGSNDNHSATQKFGSGVLDEASFAQYEQETLEAMPGDDEARALHLAWMLLEGLALTGFWGSAGDVREMFLAPVALAGGGGAAPSDVMSPITGSLGFPMSPAAAAGGGGSATYDDPFTASMTSSQGGNGGGPAPLSADEYSSASQGGSRADDAERVFNEVASSIRDLVVVGLASIAAPSATPYALRIATNTLSSPWALSVLLAHDRYRRETLDVLAAVLQCDRLSAPSPTSGPQLPLLETVCGAALTRLGPEYVAGAGLAVEFQRPGQPAGPSRDDAPNGAGETAGSDAVAVGGGAGYVAAAAAPPSIHTKTEWHLSDARSRLASAVSTNARQDIVTFLTAGSRPSRSSEEATLRNTLTCFNHLICGAEGGASPLVSSSVLGAVFCGRLIACTQRDHSPACREGALMALLQLALVDAEWALRVFHSEPYVNGALERDVPELLRFGLAAVIPSLCDGLPAAAVVGPGIPPYVPPQEGKGGLSGAIFSFFGISGGGAASPSAAGPSGGGGAAASASTRSAAVTVDPAKIGALLSQHPSSGDVPDPVVGALLRIVLADPAVACRFAASHTFVRSVVAALQHAVATGNRLARERILDIVRVLFEWTDDPSRFADDNELCTGICAIAQDPSSTLHATAAACELANAFAHVVVF
jgi:serine/threonine protein kinase